MNRTEAHAAYLRLLMDRVRQDHYPSTTHMNLIEQSLPPQLIPDYVEILIEKASQDRNPSIPMLSRIGRLVGQAR